MSLPGVALLLVRALPTEPAVLLARILVTVYLLLRPDYRAEASRNLEVVCGRANPWFWLRNAWTVGRNLALMAGTGTRRTAGLIDTATVYCDNTTRQALEQELHVVMPSLHFGLWELLPKVVARRGRRVTVVTGRQRQGDFQRVVSTLRRAGGIGEVHSARPAVEAAGEHGATGFMLDNTSQGEQAWVGADLVRMRVPTLAFELAERRGVPLIPASGRLERGRLRVKLGPPGDRTRVLAALLDEVRQRPGEWVSWAKAGAVERAA